MNVIASGSGARKFRKSRGLIGPIAVVIALSILPALSAQDRDSDRDRDRGREGDRITRIEAGTMIAVRNNDSIDVDRRDNQVYRGIVDQDVRGSDGRLAIPRGSDVELIVRVEQDNDLIIDLESVRVNGNRYAIKTEPNRQESRRDDSLVGSIVGAIQGGEARGHAVRIPRDSVLTFRLRRPLDMGVADRGVDREGHHYHDYYDDRHN
ncbi:MAG TPA: hypothetical protein VFE02_17200 [Candidatus Acidoferrales bacterium]|nr:hypothetical protein [Candidatus Acidoferrales bacterium]